MIKFMIGYFSNLQVVDIDLLTDIASGGWEIEFNKLSYERS